MTDVRITRNLKIAWLSVIVLVFASLASVRIDAAPVKIMPLGDSITGTPGCWRAILWNRLQGSGYTNIDFVGTQSWATCSLPYDQDGEGHGSILATDIADQNQLPPWLAATNPDIVLMHLGTNDILANTKTTEMILAAFGRMVDQMRANNPNMKILVAQIIPMYSASTGCSICYQKVIDLNAAIPAWADGKTTSQSQIVVVDQWTGFDTATDTSEGLHPNDAGNQKMSDKWYPPLVDILGASGTSAPTPVTTAMPGVDPTASPVTPGDVNSSGTVDIVDALLVAQYYVGLAPASFIAAAADVNRDGSIDIIDGLRIAQYYVGLITGF